MTDASQINTLQRALPFWLSLALLPVAAFAVVKGGLFLALIPLCTWTLFSALDLVVGQDQENLDPETPDDQLTFYKLITLIWMPIQVCLVFGMLIYVTNTDHLSTGEQIAAFFGVGVISGTIGITYAHELLHQPSKLERWLADTLLAMVLYSHFRSEHLLVHHRYVATPRDPVTARYNEGFYRYFPRVVRQSFVSAFRAEKAMLERKGLPWWDRSNPYWRYWAMQVGFLLLAALIGGWAAVGLFAVQAATAVWQLELVNYVEHYGLTRKHLGDGSYEHVAPRHSWNASQKASNWLLINLQRHSDHHFRPDRRFPLLQSYARDEAPQLPYGYTVMTAFAMAPHLWRRMMNPRVRKWRAMYYPEITDWTPYSKAATPLPR
jgi:alkane 1-monooxygenase